MLYLYIVLGTSMGFIKKWKRGKIHKRKRYVNKALILKSHWGNIIIDSSVEKNIFDSSTYICPQIALGVVFTGYVSIYNVKIIVN